MGVSVDNLAHCGADYASDPAGCFASDHLTAWEPSSAWTGTVDFSLPMLSRKAVPEPYSSHSALKIIKRNLEWGVYGTGTSENPGTFPYASNYQNLARSVSDNLSHSYIDIGVESEGDWNPTQFGPDPTAWARYYENIQMTMSGVPGAHFRFVWTTGLFVSTTATDGTTKVSPEAAYPGDQAVNVVALDWYDANFGQVQINGRSYDNHTRCRTAPESCRPAASSPPLTGHKPGTIVSARDQHGLLRLRSQLVVTVRRGSLEADRLFGMGVEQGRRGRLSDPAGVALAEEPAVGDGRLRHLLQ